MAREKGTGNLQREKSGRWTVRVGINGRRLSRSARTTDRDKAERFLNRFLAPLGLGAERLPLADAWHHYEMSPNRRDIATTTLDTKRSVWMAFARWVEKYHLEITELSQVTEQAVAEYLSGFAATTPPAHTTTMYASSGRYSGCSRTRRGSLTIRSPACASAQTIPSAAGS